VSNEGDGEITVKYTGYKTRNGINPGTVLTVPARYIEAR
jgi:hypothetical protein